MFLFCTSLLLSFVVQSQDCIKCKQLAESIQIAKKEEASLGGLLVKNRAVLATLSPSDISKKVKLSSNILILTAKIEKFQNERTIFNQQTNQMGCKTCPI